LLFGLMSVIWGIPYLFIRIAVDEISPAAAAIGTVNTVVFDSRRAIGHNTDAYGFEQNLTRRLPSASLDKVILLGAGRTATFPALVPGFSMIIGYLALGVVPSIPQLVGLVIVVIGFRFTMR